MLINTKGERKELQKVKDFICENCGTGLFTTIGYVKTIHLKENVNKHYSLNTIGIECVMCGKEYFNTDSNFI